MLSKDEVPSSAALRERLREVYWIGGGSGGGKSTIARCLAARHGFRVYATDDVMADHARRSTAEDSPLLHQFISMNMDERWVNRSAQTMLETFPWFQGECFNLVVEDLLRVSHEPNVIAGPPERGVAAFPRERGVIVEGFRLLPRLVAPLLTRAIPPLASEPAHAVWLLPTPAFRQAVIEERGGPTWGFLARTSDPETALRNLLERDRMFTQILRAETARLRLPAIEVDATMTEDDLAERVTELFGL